ncbi:alpha-L-fucosidase [Streptomyces sp. NPDC057565]|uniref:alpha-L-fucosidase n=1 Tax=Streptomyces sp. NPDC057565 TaxID=3346169 RepID=UPI0036B42DD1
MRSSLVLAITATAVLVAPPALADASHPPTAQQLKITGSARTKGGLEVGYRFQDPDGDTEGATRFRWLAGPAKDGPWTPLTGVLTRNIGIPLSYGGQYLRAEVTPVDETGMTGRSRLSPPVLVKTAEGNPGTDWLHNARYGLSHHFLSNYLNRVAASPEEKWQDGESWDDLLKTFDVEAYADDMEKAGAGFAILTLGQNSGYMLAPNHAYERIAGLQPGERTPAGRDLPMEIADALAKRGIKLVLYIPANPPHSAHKQPGDYAITKAFGYTPGTDGVPSQDTMAKWQSVIREYSERYGTKLAGWWVDGVFPGLQPAYQDMTKPYNWSSLAAALKAGNPDRIITLNSGLGARNHQPTSVYDDYTPGESGNIGAMPSSGRWADAEQSTQWFDFTYLGANDPGWAGWGNKGTSKDTTSLVRWLNAATGQGAAIGLDTKVNRYGRLDPAQLAQLEQVRKVVREGAPVPEPEGGLYNDTDFLIRYVGSWAGSSGRPGDLNGDVHYTRTDGDSAEFTFSGSGIEYITERNTDMGQVDVYLDGTLKGTVDCYSATKQTQQVLFKADGLTAGTHTIRVVKKSGTYMLVDALRVTG